MTDDRDVLERAARQFAPAPGIMDRVYERRRKKQRNRRVGTAVLALGLAAAAIGGTVAIFRQGTVPARPGPPAHNGRVVFVSPGQSGPDDLIYTVASNGKDLQQFRVTAEYPDWSPDGSLIAFDTGSTIAIRNWTEATGHIFTMPAEGGDLQQLTFGAGAEFTPRWSPDGTQVAVTAQGQEDGGPPGIFLLNVDTGAMARVTTNPYTGYLDKEPDWSPDGSQIVFVRERELVDAGGTQNLAALFIVNIDGSGLRQLTQWAGAVGTPSWSPSGSTIVYRQGDVIPPPGAELAQIFTIDVDGEGLRQLTSDPGAACYWPSWSPDGTLILFTRYVFNPDSQDHQPDTPQTLYTMDETGGNLARFSSAITFQNEGSWGTHP